METKKEVHAKKPYLDPESIQSYRLVSANMVILYDNLSWDDAVRLKIEKQEEGITCQIVPV